MDTYIFVITGSRIAALKVEPDGVIARWPELQGQPPETVANAIRDNIGEEFLIKGYLVTKPDPTQEALIRSLISNVE